MRRLAATAVLMLAAAALVGRGAADDEPTVNGKPLSAWTAQLKDKDPQITGASTAAPRTHRQPLGTSGPGLSHRIQW